ncbi:hypothetical protein ACQY0O_008419 [Thecaphora frezii]
MMDSTELPTSSSPKRRRLLHDAPIDLQSQPSHLLVHHHRFGAANAAYLDPPRPVRRNAQCLAPAPTRQGDTPPDLGLAPGSLANGEVGPSEISVGTNRCSGPPSLDNGDAGASGPTSSPLPSFHSHHYDAPITSECDNDDLEAATQRSILQELHEIQEEHSQSFAPGQAANDSVLLDNGDESFVAIYPYVGDPVESSRQQEDPTSRSHGDASDGDDPRTTYNRLLDTPQAVGGPTPDGEATRAAIAVPEAAATAIPVGEAAVEAGAAAVVAAGDPSVEAIAEDAADYSLLFEGLDADAFDDIELSPVDPIKTSRPAQGSLAARGPPSSPLVARKRIAADPLRVAGSLVSARDEDSVFRSPSKDERGRSHSPCEPSSPGFIPPVAFQGFRTAANGKLAEPSDVAMKRALRLVFSQSEQLSQQSSQASRAGSRIEPGPADAKGKGMQLGDDEFDDFDFKVEAPDPIRLGGGGGGFAGFSNAKGVALRPSEAALSAARRLFAEIENEADGALVSRTPPPPPAMDRSKRRPTASMIGPSEVAATSGTATAGSGSASPLIVNVAAAEQASGSGLQLPGEPQQRNPRDDHTVESAACEAQPTDGDEQPSEQRPVAVGEGKDSQALTVAATAAAAMSTPMRPLPVPIQSHKRSTLLSDSSRFGIATRATPTSQKRISLGMTPRGKQQGSGGSSSARPKFRTPFKNGGAPSTYSASSVTSPFRTPLGACRQLNIAYPPPSSTLQSSKSLQKLKNASRSAAATSSAVFDLTVRRPRQTLASSGIIPEGVSPLQAIARGVPDEVLVILSDASKAAFYAFDGDDGHMLGPQQALETLLARGCPYADLKWVKNHWSLILWKLASLTRHRPDEAVWRWSWDEVIRQLLYRYEREVNQAQRSCIKRIQEHDSPAHLPMVLFVARILEFQEQTYDEPGSAPRREVTLELSDGWYRIRADLDAPLSDAASRGRIRVGQKLAIAGAKLQSSGDGTEVLDALLTSTLSLCGNSVSLARWDARLGFSRQPFFASLRSLTPEGGVVAAMDVFITKVFPLAYIDADANLKAGQAAPRGEAEEHEAREAWLRRLEETQARLEARFDQGSRKLDALLLALEAASEGHLPSSGGLSGSSGSGSKHEDEAFSMFCSIEEHDDPVVALKRLVLGAGKSYLVPHLMLLVRSRLMADGEEGRYLLRNELERLCPPRRVRDFRVVRFRDARLPPPLPPAMPASTPQRGEARSATPARAPSRTRGGGSGGGGGGTNGVGANKKNAYARTVQLTVWDAASLGDGLREGARFVVTNLVPTQKRSWRRPDDAADVFLSTRRDTRWTRVE